MHTTSPPLAHQATTPRPWSRTTAQHASLQELRSSIQALTQQGGLISPSIYDTAQVLRYWPIGETSAVVGWLCAQQQPDGGWGDPSVPHTRTAPTLAALLALHEHAPASEATIRAVAFLQAHGALWDGPLRDDLSVGAELIIPQLLAEANAAGLGLDMRPYEGLAHYGARRKMKIQLLGRAAPQTALHSWECWGDWQTADASQLDESGSVAHNPAATAAWLAATRDRDDLAAERERAAAYLRQCTQATGLAMDGVVPGIWPIPHFELAFTLYSIFIAGLLDHPQIADVVTPQIDALSKALRPRGIGLNSHFLTDGDDTATTYAVLAAAQQFPELDPLHYFAADDHYCAYPGELHASVSVTAHAIHALRMRGQPVQHLLPYLIDRQQPDGRWLADKWNRSWLYTTTRILIAAGDLLPQSVREHAIDRLLQEQHADGGWGLGRSTGEETAYALLLFCTLRQHSTLGQKAQHAAQRASIWLQHAQPIPAYCWIDKELYEPYRITQVLQQASLCAWLAD